MRPRDLRTPAGGPLVWRFAAAALVVFVLVGAMVIFRVAHEVIDREVRDGELRAEAIARSVMAVFTASGDPRSPASGDRLADLDSLLQQAVGWPVVRLKIWNGDGIILYSDDAALIGQHFPIEDELAEAFRSGRSVSDVTDLARVENVDERPMASKLIETYVPYPLGPVSGDPSLVAEVYQDYSSIESQAYRVGGTIGTLLLLGLGILYLLLLPIVRRVSRTLTQQNATLEAQTERLEEMLTREQDALADRRRLLDEMFRTDEEDRRRVANELHDGPLHCLAIMGVTLERVRLRLDEGDPTSARSLLEGVQSDLSESIQDLRALMRGLRPPALDERGLDAAITDHADAMMEDGGVRYEFSSTIDLRLDPAVEGVLYRVAQEAVTNVARHARAEHAWISLEQRNGNVCFEVRDDGEGFDPLTADAMTRDGRFGLMTMRERVEMLGGSLRIDSSPGRGTRLRATLPSGAGR